MTFSQWQQDAEERIRKNLPVFPNDKDQFRWLVENYPGHQCLPPRKGMRHLGLPAFYGRLKSHSEMWRERVVLTAIENPDFAKALRLVLRMEDAV